MRFCYDDVGYMLWEMGYRAINKQVESDIAEMLEDVDEGKEKDFLHHLINTVAYWFIDEEEEQRAYEEENIPISRGLGSSSSCIVAGVLIAAYKLGIDNFLLLFSFASSLKSRN